MKNTKRILSLVLALAAVAVSVLAFASCSTEKKDKFTVGICQLVQHDALDAATKGFKDALIAELGEENVSFLEQNASNDTAVCTTICNDFVSKKVDLIMANATPALQAAYNSTQTIPVLGTSVTEYSSILGIENFNGIVGSNISGTSDLAPLDKQAQMIIDLVPGVEKVGIIYCSAEANSKYQVNVVKAYLESKNITVTEYPFSDSNDVSIVTTKAASESDALYIPTDNTAASCKSTIGNIVLNEKVPLIAGEEGICSACGIATLTISYYDLGVATGKMAAKILKGEEKISEMPIEYAEAYPKYNRAICEELNITVPDGYEEIK